MPSAPVPTEDRDIARSVQPTAGSAAESAQAAVVEVAVAAVEVLAVGVVVAGAPVREAAAHEPLRSHTRLPTRTLPLP